jgi:transforming growth factor-beta-induced protein
MRTRTFRMTALAAVASLSLLGAACSDDGGDEAGADEPTETTQAEESTDTTAMEESGGEAEMAATTGPACSAVPSDGEGSLSGMADDPAATAASNNPELTTLVQAVTEAGLVDTLNGEGPFTIFAPVNSAFAKIPAADLQAVLADKELLSSILTLHVVAGEQLDSEALAEVDSVPTANGADITIDASGDSVMVNGQAEVVCANIPTANATVHLIDSVLMPQS